MLIKFEGGRNDSSQCDKLFKMICDCYLHILHEMVESRNRNTDNFKRLIFILYTLSCTPNVVPFRSVPFRKV